MKVNERLSLEGRWKWMKGLAWKMKVNERLSLEGRWKSEWKAQPGRKMKKWMKGFQPGRKKKKWLKGSAWKEDEKVTERRSLEGSSFTLTRWELPLQCIVGLLVHWRGAPWWPLRRRFCNSNQWIMDTSTPNVLSVSHVFVETTNPALTHTSYSKMI